MRAGVDDYLLQVRSRCAASTQPNFSHATDWLKKAGDKLRLPFRW